MLDDAFGHCFLHTQINLLWITRDHYHFQDNLKRQTDSRDMHQITGAISAENGSLVLRLKFMPFIIYSSKQFTIMFPFFSFN